MNYHIYINHNKLVNGIPEFEVLDQEEGWMRDLFPVGEVESMEPGEVKAWIHEDIITTVKLKKKGDKIIAIPKKYTKLEYEDDRVHLKKLAEGVARDLLADLRKRDGLKLPKRFSKKKIDSCFRLWSTMITPRGDKIFPADMAISFMDTEPKIVAYVDGFYIEPHDTSKPTFVYFVSYNIGSI